MKFPEKIKYTKEHEWISVDGDIGTVGITDYAQSELGDVVFVELPAIGRTFNQGESFGTIEAVKAVSDIYAPISGEVVEINSDLEKAPELVNKDPYGKGWMLRLKITDVGQLKKLIDVNGYRELIGK